MATLEASAENVEILLLEGQAALDGFSIVRKDEDALADKDRIIVDAEPRKVALYNAQGTGVVAWEIDVIVTVHLVTRDVDQYDDIIAAIEAANMDAAPQAAIDAAEAAFPNGVRIENTDDGAQATESDSRQREKTFRFIVAN